MSRVIVKIVTTLTALLLVGVTTVSFDDKVANAADLSQFNPGNIISDSVFYNGNSMSSSQVQSFLNSKVPNCTINNGQPTRAAGAPYGSTFIAESCLKNYRQQTPSMSAQPGLCSPYQGSANESAAEIITKIGQACNISQKVLLVLLEKEQSLVSDTWPTVKQLNQATGFACYDNGQPCVQEYSGFFYQVWSAARQLQKYGSSPFTWYPVGQVSNVLFQANMPQCGSKSVLIENRATAALYYYTPYTPNQASLNAGYGLGDSCSAYGNRNFYQLFVDWFGSTQDQSPRSPLSPLGKVESVQSGPNSANITGWVFDPETANPVTIHVYLGGTHNAGGSWAGAFVADKRNEFVSRTYPAYGLNKGFNFTIPNLTSPAQACIYAINVGNGEDTLISCTWVSPGSGSPLGNFEGAWLEGLNAKIQGWVIDPDTDSPVKVHAYLGGPYGVGHWGGEFLANSTRADLGNSYPLYSSTKGLSSSMPVSPGSTPICLYAIDTQITGASTFLGCKTVSSASGPPIGNLENISSGIGTIKISGWALDPDSTSPIQLHVYVDGRWGGAYTTELNRLDVGTAYPGYGDNHGFSVETSQGVVAGTTNNVCVFGINVGSGYNSLIGCKKIAVGGGMPFGNIDSYSSTSNGANFGGWLIDPDTTLPVIIHAYVNGAWGGSFTANSPRGDVANYYPAWGLNHGFNFSVPLNSGTNNVCLYAINTGAGQTNPLLGCRNVIF